MNPKMTKKVKVIKKKAHPILAFQMIKTMKTLYNRVKMKKWLVNQARKRLKHKNQSQEKLPFVLKSNKKKRYVLKKHLCATKMELSLNQFLISSDC